MLERSFVKTIREEQLEDEIIAAGIALDTRFFGCGQRGADAIVFVADNFSGAEDTTLSGVVTAHTPDPVPILRPQLAVVQPRRRITFNGGTVPLGPPIGIDPARAYWIDVDVVARSPGESAIFRRLIRASRVGAGAPTIATPVGSSFGDATAGAATWTCAFAVVANTVVVNITGSAGVTVQWIGQTRFQKI